MNLYHFDNCSLVVDESKLEDFRKFINCYCEDYSFGASYLEDDSDKNLSEIVKNFTDFSSWSRECEIDEASGMSEITYTKKQNGYLFEVEEGDYAAQYSCEWKISQNDTVLFEDITSETHKNDSLYVFGDGLPFVFDDMLKAIANLAPHH